RIYSEGGAFPFLAPFSVHNVTNPGRLGARGSIVSAVWNRFRRRFHQMLSAPADAPSDTSSTPVTGRALHRLKHLSAERLPSRPKSRVSGHKQPLMEPPGPTKLRKPVKAAEAAGRANRSATSDVTRFSGRTSSPGPARRC